MHPHYPCRDNETLHPVRGYFAITNDCSCKVTDHRGTHVTGRSHHLQHYAWWASILPAFIRPSAVPAFIWQIAFLTISLVIGMGGPSTGGSSDRWSRSQSNSTLRSLRLCSYQAFCFTSSLNDISSASFFTSLPPITSVFTPQNWLARQ